MARKRTLLVLQQLAEDSGGELVAMAAELCGDSERTFCGARPAHWSERFAASGKVALGKKALANDKDSV